MLTSFQSLPYKGLKFWNTTAVDTILETPGDAEAGCFVEDDLEFTQEVHMALKEFPRCPEILTP